MTLVEKLNIRAENKYPIYTRKNPCPCCKVYADCPSRVKNKTQQRETYIAWWLLKYRKRYERMFGHEVRMQQLEDVVTNRIEAFMAKANKSK